MSPNQEIRYGNICSITRSVDPHTIKSTAYIISSHAYTAAVSDEIEGCQAHSRWLDRMPEAYWNVTKTTVLWQVHQLIACCERAMPDVPETCSK
jgi:hypothetical protein